jgi:hypothetical protein
MLWLPALFTFPAGDAWQPDRANHVPYSRFSSFLSCRRRAAREALAETRG